MLVERGVVVTEALVVRQVTGPRPVVDRAHQAGRGGVTADPAGGLDVLRGALGLTGHHHQAKALNVHADRNHVRGQHHVQR